MSKGETQTFKWKPDRVGVVLMYCTDFCSALHQEMQGYVRGSPVALRFGTGAGIAFSGVVMVAWLVAPLWLGLRVFKNRK